MDEESITESQTRGRLFLSWKVIAPVLFSIILALSGLVYNHTQDQIKQLQELKAEKAQLNLLINHQNELIKAQAELFGRFEDSLSTAIIDIACLKTQLDVYITFNASASSVIGRSIKPKLKLNKKITKPVPKFNPKIYIDKFKFSVKK